MTRFDLIKGLTPEQFLAYIKSNKSSVCAVNANGERKKTHCAGKFCYDCDLCQRNFWIEENIEGGDEIKRMIMIGGMFQDKPHIEEENENE